MRVKTLESAESQIGLYLDKTPTTIVVGPEGVWYVCTNGEPSSKAQGVGSAGPDGRVTLNNQSVVNNGRRDLKKVLLVYNVSCCCVYSICYLGTWYSCSTNHRRNGKLFWFIRIANWIVFYHLNICITKSGWITSAQLFQIKTSSDSSNVDRWTHKRGKSYHCCSPSYESSSGSKFKISVYFVELN